MVGVENFPFTLDEMTNQWENVEELRECPRCGDLVNKLIYVLDELSPPEICMKCCQKLGIEVYLPS